MKSHFVRAMETFVISIVFLVFGCLCLVAGGTFEYMRYWANVAAARLEKLNTNPSLRPPGRLGASANANAAAAAAAVQEPNESSSSEEEILAVPAGSHRMSRRPSRSRVLYAATPAVKTAYGETSLAGTPAVRTAYGETSLAGTQVGQLPLPPKRPPKPVLRDSTVDLRIAGPGREILRPDYGDLEVIPLSELATSPAVY